MRRKATVNAPKNTKIPHKWQQVMDLLQTKGVILTGDVEQIGIDRKQLQRWTNKGYLVRHQTGVYTLPIPHDHPEKRLLLAAAELLTKQAVVYLRSALLHYGVLEGPEPPRLQFAFPRNTFGMTEMRARFDCFRPMAHNLLVDLVVSDISGVPLRIHTLERCVVNLVRQHRVAYRYDGISAQEAEEHTVNTIRRAYLDKRFRIRRFLKVAQGLRSGKLGHLLEKALTGQKRWFRY